MGIESKFEIRWGDIADLAEPVAGFTDQFSPATLVQIAAEGAELEGCITVVFMKLHRLIAGMFGIGCGVDTAIDPDAITHIAAEKHIDRQTCRLACNIPQRVVYGRNRRQSQCARWKTATILSQPHIEAARMLGFGSRYILMHYVLPVIAPMISTLAAFAMATAIIAVSTLSAINVGLQPPTPELGSMIVELLPYFAEAPMQVLLPAALIFLLVLGLQLLAQGERA